MRGLVEGGKKEKAFTPLKGPVGTPCPLNKLPTSSETTIKEAMTGSKERGGGQRRRK